MKNLRPLLVLVLSGLMGLAVYFYMSRQEQPDLAKKLVNEIETAVSNGNRQIDIARLTDFTWDNLYIFAPYTTPEQINDTLGFIWPEGESSDITLHDDITLLVFVDDGRVVEYFEFQRVQGDFAEAASLAPYTPFQATFFVDNTVGIKLMPTQPAIQRQ